METSKDDIRSRMKADKCCIIIPTYNNSKTIEKVIADAKTYCEDVYVVNDGSTDETHDLLSSIDGIRRIEYMPNGGKGVALKTGLSTAHKEGFRYAITIDSDGQHFLEDVPLFLDAIEKNPDAMIVGIRNIQQENMPSKNTFANKFSNFWFKTETGQSLSDTQCGYRLYPLDKVADKKYLTSRYEFELEILVRSAWNDVKIIPQPIKVYYAPAEERVSHFKPLRDFTRISILNTIFVLIAFLWVKPRNFLRSISIANIKKFIHDNFTHSKDSNSKLATAVGLGLFFGIIPIWGWQMVVAFIVAKLLKVNQWITLAMSNISIPPAIPFILWGSYATGGILLGCGKIPQFDNISFETVKSDLCQYILGSFVFASVMALVGWCITYLLLLAFRKKK